MGRLTYFTTLAMPSATGALICSIFLPDDVVHTYAHGLSSICAEVLLKGSDFFILKYLRSSRAAFTCALMVVNTLLMHGLRENSDGGFYWLIQPSKRKFEDQCHGSICAHDSDCTSYVLEVIEINTYNMRIQYSLPRLVGNKQLCKIRNRLGNRQRNDLQLQSTSEIAVDWLEKFIWPAELESNCVFDCLRGNISREYLIQDSLCLLLSGLSIASSGRQLRIRHLQRKQ